MANALDRRDDGLGQGDDLLHQGRATLHQISEIRCPAIGIGAPRGHFLEMMPGAEGRALRREDHDADVAVIGDGSERVGERRDHRIRERVARGCVVQGDGGDTVRIRAPQGKRVVMRGRFRRLLLETHMASS